jgi:hypothetical protein
VSKRSLLTVALAISVLVMMVPSELAAEEGGRSDETVIEEMAKAMEVSGHPEKKRALLAEAAKLRSLRALRLTAAAADDKEMADAAIGAAGQIAQALMAAEQPAYMRRAAFLHWVACQSERQAAKAVTRALRGDDAVLQSAAISVLRERPDGALLEPVAAAVPSFPSTVQTSLLEVFAGRSDAAAASALVAIARHKDKPLRLKAIAALSELGGEAALSTVRDALADPDAEVRQAALQSLAGWTDASPLPILLNVARKSESEEERILALRGMAALALATKLDEAARSALLSALKRVAERAANGGANEEAVLAAVQIAQALTASHPDDVRRALEAFATCKLSDRAEQRIRAARLTFTIDTLPNLARGAKATSPDGIAPQGPHPASHAIDGDTATYWDDSDGHPLYRLRVEFDRPTDVSAISVVGWAHHNFSPRDFEVVCDGKTVRAVTDATYVSNRLIVGLPRTRCTSLELKITGCYGGSPAVRELAIFNAP